MASGVGDEKVGRGTGEGRAGEPAGTGSACAAQPLDPQLAAAVAAGSADGEAVRVDIWIWAVRLIKTRSLGAAACRAGHVHVNGKRVKPARCLRVGDKVRLRHEDRELVVIVKHLIRKRVGATVAAQCYIDKSPPPPARDTVAPAGLRDRGTGRPTKRDRRELDRLRGLAAGSPTFFAFSTGPSGPDGAGGAKGSDGRRRTSDPNGRRR
ncbi:RNA-binding S4 domain-containing protein [Streptomyces sp. NPDC006184]|uniref:RNA-binding S4 domain-containing protein n=1 Tax=Streptomyces sp. NPDC006184 TaxID=3155455 RepID=UPI0033BA2335